LNKMK
jgi:hypothetical protein